MGKRFRFLLHLLRRLLQLLQLILNLPYCARSYLVTSRVPLAGDIRCIPSRVRVGIWPSLVRNNLELDFVRQTCFPFICRCVYFRFVVEVISVILYVCFSSDHAHGQR